MSVWILQEQMAGLEEIIYILTDPPFIKIIVNYRADHSVKDKTCMEKTSNVGLNCLFINLP